MSEYLGRGGKREGSGRPKMPEKDIAKKRQIRLTDLEYNNYLKLGGAKWLRPILRGEKNV
ncbi:MAG: hypothetical protein IKR34_02195 [Candidatus Gastranaerophilales bacterium]|nr:hypothetical protein [Elusimicrobiota bacterium]MBR6298034.1 hypothetical protein [Candidatus Gastranaerophilales bacterium]